MCKVIQFYPEFSRIVYSRGGNITKTVEKMKAGAKNNVECWIDDGIDPHEAPYIVADDYIKGVSKRIVLSDEGINAENLRKEVIMMATS